MSFVGPAALSAVRQQIAAINTGIDGGFAAILASATATSSSPSSASPSAPSAPGVAAEIPTALLAGAMTTPPGLTAGPSSTASPSRPTPSPTLVSQTAGTGATPGLAGSVGRAAVGAAENYLGVPYVWGGESPSGFDCSGLVQYVYRRVGIDLPRTSQEQATVGTPVPSLADAKPGDLVFFAGSDGTTAHPGHVGIYIGNGEMIDAPYTGTDVQIQPVANPAEIRDVSGLASTPAPSGPAASAGGPYASIFAAATSRFGLPAGLLQAVAETESGGDPAAVSGAGAEGIMQLMPSTAAGLGVDPFDPSQAIPAAAGMLSSYLQRFGSVPLALAAYNAGPGAVETYGGVPPFPQTVQYVAKIESLMNGYAQAPGNAGGGSVA